MNASKTEVLWRNAEDTSLEYFTLQSIDDGFILEGTIIALLEQLPTKVIYSVMCDGCWRTKQVDVNQNTAKETRRLTLAVDSNQHWQINQTPLQFATGLFDVDFEISPATNTLPIHRLNLDIGDTQETEAVWVRFPSLTLERLQQRYTRTGDRSYRYEAPKLGFQAQLEVDSAGLVLKYGDLWKRIP